MNTDDYKNLRHLFGAYFHQDWPEEYRSPDEAIEAFKTDEAATSVHGAREELARVIPALQEMANPEEFLVDTLWCNYIPSSDDLTAVEWLKHVFCKLGCHP